jgi:Deacetylase PdaC
MAKDVIFSLAYPRLLSHPDAALMVKINTLLENEHRAAVASARQCQEYLPGQRLDEIKTGKATEAENKFEVVYVNPQLLSMTESGSIFCGGAHPSNFTRSMNFDLTTVERLFERETNDSASSPLSEKNLGRIFKLNTQKDRENFNSFWWSLWLQAAAKATKDDPYCEDGSMNDRPMAERSADFHFTPKGLAVRRTNYGHAMSVCLFQNYNPLTIPWADLKHWLKRDQNLLLDEIK